jgi:hypothetical protein
VRPNQARNVGVSRIAIHVLGVDQTAIAVRFR